MDNKQFAMTSSFQLQSPPAAPSTPRVSVPIMTVSPKKWIFPSLSCDWKLAKKVVQVQDGDVPDTAKE